MANAGPVNRTTLNALTPNLDIGDVADPALRLAFFQYICDLMDANWSDYATNRITLSSVDGGNFTDTFTGTSYDLDGGAF